MNSFGGNQVRVVTGMPTPSKRVESIQVTPQVVKSQQLADHDSGGVVWDLPTEYTEKHGRNGEDLSGELKGSARSRKLPSQLDRSSHQSCRAETPHVKGHHNGQYASANH